MSFDQIVYLISSVRDYSYELITNELKKNNIKGLVPSHGAILFQLFKNKEISMKELSEKINRDKSTVTVLVDKIVSQGLAERKENPEDKRGVLIFITKKGLALEPVFHEISKNLMKVISAGLTGDEKEKMAKTLKKILHNFTNQD